MGISNSKAAEHANPPNAKAFSLDAFIADMVKQMVESTVDRLIEDKRLKRIEQARSPSELGKSLANPEAGKSDLQIIDPTNEFFRSALAADNNFDGLEKDDQLSSSSSTTSSSPVEGSTDTQISSTRNPEEVIVGTIASTPSRLVPLLEEAIQFFWNLRISCKLGTFEEALRMAQYPPRFLADCVEEEDVKLGILEHGMSFRFLNRAMLFDYVREMLQRIYQGEDEDIRMNRPPVISSSRYRLWLGVKRPNSFNLIQNIVRKNLESELNISLTADLGKSVSESFPTRPTPTDLNRLPQLARWTILRKDWLDQLLEMEMRADESTWLDYTPFEKEVLNSLTVKVMRELFDEVHDLCIKKMAKEMFKDDARLATKCNEQKIESKITNEYGSIAQPQLNVRNNVMTKLTGQQRQDTVHKVNICN